LGSLDPYVVSTMANLWVAGITHADTYLFPCAGLGAANQVRWFVGNLTQSGTKYGMIWLDIEQNVSAVSRGDIHEGSNRILIDPTLQYTLALSTASRVSPGSAWEVHRDLIMAACIPGCVAPRGLQPSAGCGWPTDLAGNCQYVQAMGDELTAQGVNWGIYR